MASPNQPDYATLGTSSTLTAKRVEIRCDDYSTSSKSVCLKAYDSSEAYTVFLPKEDPFTASPNTDTVLTYDVVAGEFKWKQSTGSTFFIQAETDSTKDDENGNVLTCSQEVPLVQGDPGYDPARDPTHASFDAALGGLYKAQTAFTDDLYNMSQFTAGKATVGATVLTKTTGMYFEYESGANPGLASVDANKQAIDQLLLTTKTDANDIAHSSLKCNTSIVDLGFHNAATQPTSLTLQDDSVKMKSQDKEIMAGTLNVMATKVYPLQSSNTASSLVQKPHSLSMSFGSDSSKFAVDNGQKKIDTDMSCIEFGEAGSKHRLKIIGGKLYLQQFDAAQSKWIGADVVVDAHVGFTGDIAVSGSPAITGSGTAATVDITATASGTNATAWKAQINDFSDAAFLKASGALTETMSLGPGLQPGTHNITVWPVDAAGAQLGEKQTVEIVIPA